MRTACLVGFPDDQFARASLVPERCRNNLRRRVVDCHYPAGVIGMDTLPLWIWFLGAFLLGFILIYGIMRNRTRTRGDRIVTEEATRQRYREENRRSG